MATQVTALGIFEDYLNTVENFLAGQADAIQNRRQKYLEIEHGISSSDLEKMSDLELLLLNFGSDLAYRSEYSGLSDYNEYFPRILRQSVFISLYAYCENLLNQKCYELQSAKKLPLSLKDLSGNGMTRARNYLSKVAQVEFPNGKEWQEIRIYGKLRNCLVHNSGEISGLSEVDAKFLRNYASTHLCLEVQEFPPITVIEINKGFCEEVIQVLDKFQVQFIRSCLKVQIEE